MYLTSGLNSILNDVFPYTKQAVEFMKTDIKKVGTNYVMEVDLPGVAKEDISISLEKGYMTVLAKTTKSDVEYVIRERANGEYGRRYYVGNELEETDIKASYMNGVLTLTFPIEKKVAKKSILID